MVTTGLWLAGPAPAQESPLEIPGLAERWTGDFDGMVKRRRIRVLVVYSKTFYFVDRGRQRGTAYEALKLFEAQVNKKLGTKALRVKPMFIPVGRQELIPSLVEGRGDIAAANLTITPERRKLVDFSDPFLTNVSEVVVTGPSAPPLRDVGDLAGKEVFVRPSSSYHESLLRLNEAFAKAGRPRIVVRPAPEPLEDEDLLEMVNAGLIPMIVVDSHKAEFWDQVFDDITVHPELAVNRGGQIAWAFRKNSPKLRKAINAFVKTHKKGTLTGNVVFNRYLRNTKWVKNARAEEELRKFRAMVDLFQNYSERYGFDWLLVTAQAYQESRLDQTLRSPRGAIGVMQILPKTAASDPINIPDIEKLEKNIHAGVKYLRFLHDRYLKDAELDTLDRHLLAFASYNAGPTRIARLRRLAAQSGLDPNRWFDNVELVAARQIGRETVQYVSNIYKYYIAYRLVREAQARKEEVKGSAGTE